MKSNLKAVLAIIVSLVILTCTILLVWTFFVYNGKKSSDEKDKTTQKLNKKEVLDLNSDLVKKLYAKLAYESNSSEHVSREFNFDDSKNEVDKLRMILASLDHNKGIKRSCSEFNSKYKVKKIDSKNGPYKLVHDCDSNLMSTIGIKETLSYTKEYVEETAKNLFGNKYKLNTSLPLTFCACANTCTAATSELGWYYDADSKLYIKYEHKETEGGIGCFMTVYKYELESAEKINDEVTLTVVFTLDEKNQLQKADEYLKKKYKFAYKFKQDSNKNYYLHSKKNKE